MKTYLKDMTNEQIIRLVKENRKIENDVIDAITENANFWIDEQLNGVPRCSEYDISDYGYSYFNLNVNVEDWDNIESAKSWLFGLNDAYDFFYKFDFSRVERYIELCEHFYDVVDGLNDVNYNKLLSRIEELQHEINHFILGKLKNEFNYDDCTMLDVADNLIFDCYKDAYIKDDDFTKVYEFVPAQEIIVA